MIRIGIYGYGNLAKGVESAIAQNPDVELKAVFTRRDPAGVCIATRGVPVLPAEKALEMKDEIDVMIICGGSATDLPEMTPLLAQYYNVVDSFDNHHHIPEHFANVNKAAEESGHLALISAGWDPGLFSLYRVYSMAALPEGETYTFWGRGVSQGHSDAIRRIPGVLDGRQYTVPVPEALARVRSGENPELTTREKHTRECYVVAEEGADLKAIEQAIVTMPDYFADYDTTVNFISMEEMKANHSGLPHGGSVIRNGVTGWNKDNVQTIEMSLTLASNPLFTASVLVSCARAIYRMHERGENGCRSILQIAPADLVAIDHSELIAEWL